MKLLVAGSPATRPEPTITFSLSSYDGERVSLQAVNQDGLSQTILEITPNGIEITGWVSEDLGLPMNGTQVSVIED